MRRLPFGVSQCVLYGHLPKGQVAVYVGRAEQDPSAEPNMRKSTGPHLPVKPTFRDTEPLRF